MKRLIALFAVIALLCCLAGCNQNPLTRDKYDPGDALIDCV